MLRSLLSALFLVSAPLCIHALEADTLKASYISSVKSLPVVRPVESVRLSSQVAVPIQMADVLRHFTGVQVKDYGGVGGLKTINVRSLGSEHVGIFLDGIQIDNAQNMQVDLGRFSTDCIETVSLFSGQKTHRLQTAKEYASGVAVHLNTERPRPLNGSEVKLKLRTGSFGTINPSIRWDKDLSPSITLRTTGEFLISNGKYHYPYFDTTLVRENGDIKSLRLEAHLFGHLTSGDWYIRTYSYGSERGFPGPVIRRAMGFPFSAERQADQDTFVQGSWTQDWSQRYATALRFKYANNYTHYNSHPEKNPMAMPYDLHYRQQSGYASLAQSYIISSPWSVDLSTDVQYNSLNSDVGQFVTPRRTSFTGALSSRVAWEKFRAAAHLVYMGAWDSFDAPNAGGGGRANSYRDAWMPSISLYWSPFKSLEVDAYVKRSYRLPSFNDLYYSQMGNSSLVPESAFQAGSDVRFNFSQKTWQTALRLSPYYNRVTDKIVAIPTSSQFRWTMLNIGTVDVTGLDVKASILYHINDLNISATGRYSFQQALDHSDPNGLTYGNQIPYIPLHSGSLSFQAQWRKWSFTWDTSLTSGKWSRTANIPDYYIEPWAISDAIITCSVLPSLSAGINLNNIFNTHYQIVQGYPMPGFNALLFIQWGW